MEETVLTTVSITINVLIWVAIYYYAKRASLSAAKVRFVRIKSAIVLAAWAVVVLTLAHSDFFADNSQPPHIMYAFMLPLLLGIGLLFSKTFRTVLRAIPAYWTILIQFARILGGLFIIAHFQGKLPGSFAYPAGIGDMIAGIAAPFVAYFYYKNPQKARPYVYAWIVFGILDFVDALVLGNVLAPPYIATLPLVVIPAFGVPREFLLQIYTLWQLRTDAQNTSTGKA